MSSREYYRELRKIARWRFDQLDQCKCEIEKKVYDDKYDLLVKDHEQQKAGGPANPALQRLLHHLEYTLGNTFRYSLLVGVCAVLEESVKAVAEEHYPDKAKRKKILDSQKGNWLQKHVYLLSTLPGFQPSERFQSDCDQFSDIITLRNCIGHAWGKVESADYPDQVRKAVDQIQVRASAMNTDLASISTDGYIILGEDMVSDALCFADDVLDGICNAMLKTL